MTVSQQKVSTTRGRQKNNRTSSQQKVLLEVCRSRKCFMAFKLDKFDRVTIGELLSSVQEEIGDEFSASIDWADLPRYQKKASEDGRTTEWICNGRTVLIEEDGWIEPFSFRTANKNTLFEGSYAEFAALMNNYLEMKLFS